MNKLFLNNLGDLGETQRASFYRFLYKGIKEEFAEFENPIRIKVKVPTRDIIHRRVFTYLFFYINDIKFTEPLFSIDTALTEDLTYSTQLYVGSYYQYFFNKRYDKEYIKKIVEDNHSKLKETTVEVRTDIFFGDIPLMTNEGTFIVNGCERVVISQIIRSPGVYFSKEFATNHKATYIATVISNRGMWSKFVLNEKVKKRTERSEETDNVYFKISELKPNVTLKVIDPNKKKNDADDNRITMTTLLNYFGVKDDEKLDSSSIAKHFTKSDRFYSFEELKYIMEKLVTNIRSGCFSIGEIGRYKVNKKLGLNLPKDLTYLSVLDLIRIEDELLKMRDHKGLSDDIDHIKNKQIRCVGDLLQNQLRIALYRLKKITKEAHPILKDLEKDLEKDLDFEVEKYPEDWIIDPRPITSTIKEFFKTSQLSQLADQTNPLSELTHKRRISVFGPNGLKRDHISTVIRDIHPSQYGRLCPIETPEGQNAGLLTSISLFGRLHYLGWIETPYFVMENSMVFSRKSPIFLNPEEEAKKAIAFCDVALTKENKITAEYISTKEDYSFSLKKSKDVHFMTTSPLQMISLATSLIPFIEHDDANRALMGSNMQRQAVPLLYPQKPIVGTGLESAACLDSGMVTKSYSEGTVILSFGDFIQIKDNSGQIIIYPLKKYWKSNQETSINQKPIVWNGEVVFSGQLIADGPSTLDGELALGRNLTIAYMPWEGYNYEDAIVISERLIIEDCLTSIHISEYETELDLYFEQRDTLTTKIPNATAYDCRHLTQAGIARLGSYVKEDDILVGKVMTCEPDESPEARFIRMIEKQHAPEVKDVSLRVPHGTEGRIIDIRLLNTSLPIYDLPDNSVEKLKFYIAQVRKIQIGDKLAGRHGNKGIISRILSRQDMPYLPDGTPVDIIFNPLGVPSRMNVGQVFECLLGLAGEKVGKRFKVLPFDEIYGKEASRILVNQKLKEAVLKTNLSWLFNNSSPGKILLRDGRTGEYFDNPITVGKSYILKLIHLVADKIHARATGPYSMITEQPLAGKSQQGGQRFGEMEVWALEAYGCSNTLQELLTIKSDDIDGRNDVYESIMIRKKKTKPTASISESFLALIRELNSLGLDFAFKKFHNNFSEPENEKIELDDKKIETESFYSQMSTYDDDPIDKENDIFKNIERRLQLREHLIRAKAEALISSTTSLVENCETDVEDQLKKLYEKYKKEYEEIKVKPKLEEKK